MQPKQFPWTKFKSNGKHTLILIQTDNILFKLYQIEKLDLEQIIAVVMIVEYVRCMSLPVNEKMKIAYWMLDIKGAQWNGLKCSEKNGIKKFFTRKKKDDQKQTKRSCEVFGTTIELYESSTWLRIFISEMDKSVIDSYCYWLEWYAIIVGFRLISIWSYSCEKRTRHLADKTKLFSDNQIVNIANNASIVWKNRFQLPTELYYKWIIQNIDFHHPTQKKGWLCVVTLLIIEIYSLDPFCER